jgi:hypothetical protein
VREACFETAGDDIAESVTQVAVGDYITPADFQKYGNYGVKIK